MEPTRPQPRRERLAVSLSAAALVIAVVLPVAGQLWSQRSRHEAQLLSQCLLASQSTSYDNGVAVFRIEVFNTGPVTARGVSLRLRGDHRILEQITAAAIRSEPPLTVRVRQPEAAPKPLPGGADFFTKPRELLVLDLERPLPPGQSARLTLTARAGSGADPALEVWISSAASPAVPAASFRVE